MDHGLRHIAEPTARTVVHVGGGSTGLGWGGAQQPDDEVCFFQASAIAVARCGDRVATNWIDPDHPAVRVLIVVLASP